MDQSSDSFDFVTDRPGHDLRYAIDSTKLRNNLDWLPRYTNLEVGIAATIAWYTENRTWWENDKKSVEEFYRTQGQ
jgi:dTDP-glucose 4,6-dehydratase